MPSPSSPTERDKTDTVRDPFYDRMEAINRQRRSPMGAYAKAITAVGGTVLSAVVATLTDDHVTDVEWINIAIIGIASVQVFCAENTVTSKYTKSILAGLMAVLTLMVSLVTDGMTTQEWWQLAIAGGTAAGVLGIKNEPYPAGTHYRPVAPPQL